MHWSSVHRRDEPVIKVNDLVYLLTKNLALPKGRAVKLLPKFVGPYPVTRVVEGKSVYELGLPTELMKCGIYNKFHSSLLHPHHTNDDDMFPSRAMADPYDFGEPVDVEWVVDDIIGHHWDGQKLSFMKDSRKRENVPFCRECVPRV